MSKAVLKVEFAGPGAGSGLHMAAIADFERNVVVDGKRQEKTAFHPGDQFHFLVQHDPRLILQRVASSWGVVQPLGQVSRPHSQEIELREATDTPDLNYLPTGPASLRWYGNAPALGQDGRALSHRSGPLPALALASYNSLWQSYRLVPAALTLAEGEEWPVLIVAYLELAP